MERGGYVYRGKNKSEVKKKEKSSHISLIQKRIRFADLRHMFPQSRLCLCDDGDCGGDGEELERKKAQNKSTHVNLSSLFISAKKEKRKKGGKKRTTLSLPLPLFLLDSQTESSKAHLPIQSNPIQTKEPSLPPNLPLVFSFFPPSIYPSLLIPIPPPKKRKTKTKKQKQKKGKKKKRKKHTKEAPIHPSSHPAFFCTTHLARIRNPTEKPAIIGRRIQIVATTGLDAQPIRTIFCCFFLSLFAFLSPSCDFCGFAVGLMEESRRMFFFLLIRYLSTPLSISESRRREVFVVVVGGRRRRRRQRS